MDVGKKILCGIAKLVKIGTSRVPFAPHFTVRTTVMFGELNLKSQIEDHVVWARIFDFNISESDVTYTHI